MNINLTLIGQTLAFIVFVWFCWQYIWPPLIRAMEDRRTKIADGLAAAEAGVKAREQAQTVADELLATAKTQAKDIIGGAQRRADEIIEEGKVDARGEGEKIIIAAKSEVDQQLSQVRESLRAEVISLALAGAEQVLMREVDSKAHTDALTKLVAQL